jgi:hypothetical protein
MMSLEICAAMDYIFSDEMDFLFQSSILNLFRPVVAHQSFVGTNTPQDINITMGVNPNYDTEVLRKHASRLSIVSGAVPKIERVFNTAMVMGFPKSLMYDCSMCDTLDEALEFIAGAMADLKRKGIGTKAMTIPYRMLPQSPNDSGTLFGIPVFGANSGIMLVIPDNAGVIVNPYKPPPLWNAELSVVLDIIKDITGHTPDPSLVRHHCSHYYLTHRLKRGHWRFNFKPGHGTYMISVPAFSIYVEDPLARAPYAW